MNKLARFITGDIIVAYALTIFLCLEFGYYNNDPAELIITFITAIFIVIFIILLIIDQR